MEGGNYKIVLEPKYKCWRHLKENTMKEKEANLIFIYI